MVELQLLKMNGKFDVGRSYDILYFEVGVAYCKAHFFYDFSILATCKLALFLWPRSSNDHFATTED
jgi:hypothetical protein